MSAIMTQLKTILQAIFVLLFARVITKNTVPKRAGNGRELVQLPKG
jgi:hypothetical protein